MSLLAIFVLVVAIVLEAMVGRHFYRSHRRLQLLQSAEPIKVGQFQSGLAKLEGRAVALDGTLAAPLSSEPCIYFRFQVEERRRSGQSHYWRTVLNDVQGRFCGLDDGTGVVGINLEEAEVDIKPLTKTSGFWKAVPQRLEMVLRERYHQSSTGWIFSRILPYSETRIDEGMPLFVAGTVTQTESGNPVFVKSDGLLLVSDLTEQVLRYRYLIISWAAGLAGIVVAVAALGAFYGLVN